MTAIKYKDGKFKDIYTDHDKHIKKSIKSFLAKYPGTCYICKGAISIGDDITMFSYGKALHATCI